MNKKVTMTVKQLITVLKNAEYCSVKELSLMSELSLAVIKTILKNFKLKEKGGEKNEK